MASKLMMINKSAQATQKPASIAIIGAGPMGLAVAYELGLQGFKPVVFEADDRVGGMAACFDFAGLQLERYYHFHCLSDTAFFQLLGELGLAGQMQWIHTRMGLYFNGRLYKWGSVGAVLGFRRIPLLIRLRYLLHAARCLTIGNWKHLDAISARYWIRQWLGEDGYQVLWHKLFAYKFFQFSDDISAAWIWSRIRRLGQSRRQLKETLGFLPGGSQQFLDGLVAALGASGTRIELGQPVTQLRSVQDGGVELHTPLGPQRFDAVISTVPLPLVAPMLQKGGASPALVETYAGQRSVACACVVIRTRQPVTTNFWTNVNDDRFEIPGIIEMGNLRPLGAAITYVPFYMPADQPNYRRSDEAFISDSIACLQAINPQLQASDILATHCSRYRYAQPVCGTHFQSTLPPLQPLANLWTVDTTMYYPEDRGISESVGYGRELARKVVSSLAAGGSSG